MIFALASACYVASSDGNVTLPAVALVVATAVAVVLIYWLERD